MANYEIKSIIENANKFCCMVSFNGNPEEYYEVESLEKDEITAVLQKVADDAEASSNVTPISFAIVEGKLG